MKFRRFKITKQSSNNLNQIEPRYKIRKILRQLGHVVTKYPLRCNIVSTADKLADKLTIIFISNQLKVNMVPIQTRPPLPWPKIMCTEFERIVQKRTQT